MASIGLYHMDLWHGFKAVPNLELIKIYSYYLEKGDQVAMVRPQDELARFNYIYFIKDSQEPLGKEASNKLNIENKKLMGYGFFGKTEILKPEIFNQKLNYTCYDSVSYKLTNKTDYTNMPKHSLIRIETNDFTDYKPDKKNIYISDNDLTKVPQALDFFQEYKNHSLIPLHTIKVNKDNINKFAQYRNLFTNHLYCIDYNAATFKEYYTDNKIDFNLTIKPYETEDHYIKRLLAIGLMYKNKQLVPARRYALKINGKPKPFHDWVFTKSWDSFATYYSGDKEIQKYILAAPSEIRLLCKTNPQKIVPSTFDLQYYF